MSRAKITVVGALRFSPDEDLLFSILVGKPPKTQTLWLEVLNVDEWPGLGKRPERPKNADKAVEEKWLREDAAYHQALHADPAYRQAASEFMDRQRLEPQLIKVWGSWAYRGKVLRLESTEPESLRDKETDILLIKHYVLRQERQYERVRREVEALENIEKLEGVSREPIPESVRLFVWQRDRGQCVKCSSRERLEFDHVIPIAAGGSSTERNIQLLCEACNRSKGSTI